MAEGADTAILEAARNGEYDRAMAALLAPGPARGALLSLAAFSAEIIRVAQLTRREPHMGEIRLQWWREALEKPNDPVTGHPVADAMKAAMLRHGWAVADVMGIIDSHAHDGLADAYADDAELIATLRLGEGALFRIAATTVGMAPGPELDVLAGDAGVAYGLARRLLALPQLVALGHVPLPQSRMRAAGVEVTNILAGEADVRGVLLDMADLAQDRLAIVRQALRGQSRKMRSAFLPLALVGPYLQEAGRAGRNPLRDPTEVAPIRRLMRLVSAHVLGRL